MASSRKALSGQLKLESARKPCGHGGWRPGGGRPRGRTTASHARRAAFLGSVPAACDLETHRGLGSLRRERLARIVRDIVVTAGHRQDFRIVHFAIMATHLHLIVEAANQVALSRAMHRFSTRLAHRINAAMGRRGKLLAERYHARGLRSPREARLAIRYVLLNARHHAADRGETLARGWLDPYSSAPWFDGWRTPARLDAPWLRSLLRETCPTARPRTWLLLEGWRRGGLIDIDDTPGRAPPS